MPFLKKTLPKFELKLWVGKQSCRKANSDTFFMCNAKLYTYYRELYIIFTNGFEIPKLQNSFHPVMFLMGHISKFDVFNAGRVLAGC